MVTGSGSGSARESDGLGRGVAGVSAVGGCWVLGWGLERLK